MRFDIVTLFPDFFHSFFRISMMGRAIKNGQIDYKIFNLRVEGKGKSLAVDDCVYGGSHGMLLRYDVLQKAMHLSGHQTVKPGVCRVLLSPRGKIFSKDLALFFSKFHSIYLICGHYEGVDARVEQHVDEVVSIGDYVLFGGEVAALVFMEAVSRYVNGVFKDFLVVEKESHGDGLLEEDQYTRPFDEKVPEILVQGNHKKIQQWQMENRLINTYEKRIDLIKKRPPSFDELKIFLKHIAQNYSYGKE